MRQVLISYCNNTLMNYYKNIYANANVLVFGIPPNLWIHTDILNIFESLEAKIAMSDTIIERKNCIRPFSDFGFTLFKNEKFIDIVCLYKIFSKIPKEKHLMDISNWIFTQIYNIHTKYACFVVEHITEIQNDLKNRHNQIENNIKQNNKDIITNKVKICKISKKINRYSFDIRNMAMSVMTSKKQNHINILHKRKLEYIKDRLVLKNNNISIKHENRRLDTKKQLINQQMLKCNHTASYIYKTCRMCLN